ncbi:EAL domain-containing protein [Actinotalea sp. AC32]|nr:EAL domain-containing protein [Actinotalea sp. AC32]
MARPTTVLAFARSTSGFYFGELLAGLTHEVAAAGGRVVVVQTLDPGDVADAVVSTPSFDLPVAWDEVDGAVAVSLAAAAPYLTRLREHGVPVVLASSRLDGLDAPVALPDNRGGTFAAVEHLLAHGHTRIGFVGNLVQTDIRERYTAYQEALAAHGLRPDARLFFEAPDNAEPGGLAAARAVAAAADRPTALMVATDRNALGLLEGLSAAGVCVPGEVAVVGFDNVEAGCFSTPSLTSVSQRFDQVGALAGRLVLDGIRGEQPPTAPQTPAAALVAARASCGCSGGLLHGTATPRDRTDQPVDAPPDASRAGAPRETSPGRMLRDELTQLLADLDDAAVPALTPDVVARVVDAAVALLEGTEAPTAAQAHDVVAALRRLGPRPDALHRVTNVVIEHIDRAPWTTRPTGPGHVGAAQVVSALWQLQAETYLRRSKAQERLLTEQFTLSASLLDAAGPDFRRLRWLEGTHVRAGVLALWSGDDGALRVVGAYDPEGRLCDVPTTTSVRSFPPAELVALADATQREACFVVPVRTRDRDWGLLSVVGEIDTSSSRDIYLHWAQLLCSAFDGEQLEIAVRASEERYAAAAAAANDGLWEWDPTTGELYASERCRALIGLPPDGPIDHGRWLDAVHPEDRDLVAAALALAEEAGERPMELEYRVRCDDGGWRWLLGRGVRVVRDGAVHRLVGSLSDIDPRKRLEERLRQAALYDELTGLPNRRLFLERLSAAVDEARFDDARQFAVVFMDLDGFKLINDSLGHLMGDRLLEVVGERLRGVVRSVDTAARFGGDEFAVLLTGLPEDHVHLVVERIQHAIAAPVHLGDHEVAVTASIGITTSTVGYTDPEDVLRDADTAMYHAKGEDRGTTAHFDAEMHARATGRLRARGELRTALADRQFVVHYQPIVPLCDTVVHHFEALVRWQHPERGLLGPHTFIPEMEEHGTIVALGEWLVDEVCRQVADWRREHGQAVTVSVNISHREFWNVDLIPGLRDALARHEVPPECLVVEITESVMMSDPTQARMIMTTLRDMGLRLHIDDFGTGQSSLHALRSFPVDALKIDGSFVRELGTVAQTSELVGLIIAMGRALGLEVVAECVETADQAARLHEMGCSSAQGWLYAKAVPGDEAGRLLGRTIGPVAVEG